MLTINFQTKAPLGLLSDFLFLNIMPCSNWLMEWIECRIPKIKRTINVSPIHDTCNVYFQHHIHYCRPSSQCNDRVCGHIFYRGLTSQISATNNWANAIYKNIKWPFTELSKWTQRHVKNMRQADPKRNCTRVNAYWHDIILTWHNTIFGYFYRNKLVGLMLDNIPI